MKVMVLSGIWAFLLSFALKTWAAENVPAGFDSLYSSDLSGLAGSGALSADVPLSKSYAVNYALRGVLTRYDDRVAFNTPDGRVFELKISGRLARRYNGHTVEISAQAKEADDLSVLKVDKISDYAPSAQEVTPPYIAQRKPAKMVSDDGAALTLENVRWNQGPVTDGVFDWTTATIRPDLVKNVYFIKKPFAPEWIAAHSFFVFTFEDGGLTDAAGRKTDALVLTIEAYLKEGQEYSLTEGLKNKFSIVWLLATWEDYSARTANIEHQRLIPYPVIMSHAEKAALVRESLRQAAVNRDGEFYNTITNNCTNNLVILMNRAMDASKRVALWTIPSLVYYFHATMPVWVPPYLQKKGLLGAELPAVDHANFPVTLP